MRRLALLLVLLLLLVPPARTQDEWLLLRMNAFASEYNAFAGNLREGRFDLRQAKKLSKLWREVEGSGNWPQVK